MKQEMVKLTLYEDGTYKVEDSDPDYKTQRMYGVDKDGRGMDIYYCRKDKWEWYILRVPYLV